MREIEFRGLRKDRKYSVYGDLIQYKENDFRILENKYGYWDILHDGIEVIPETVGQYTGLKDKNGKKIFEGDFLTGNLIVLWDIENCKFWLKDKYDLDFSKPFNYVIDLEVLGNIHENPELLK